MKLRALGIGVFIALSAGACGIVPGADKAGDASVPAFPDETVAPPTIPNADTELALRAERKRLLLLEEQQGDEAGDEAEDEAEDIGVETPGQAPSPGVDFPVPNAAASVRNVGSMTRICFRSLDFLQDGRALYMESAKSDTEKMRTRFLNVISAATNLADIAPTELHESTRALLLANEPLGPVVRAASASELRNLMTSYVNETSPLIEDMIGDIRSTCPDADPVDGPAAKYRPIPSAEVFGACLRSGLENTPSRSCL